MMILYTKERNNGQFGPGKRKERGGGALKGGTTESAAARPKVFSPREQDSIMASFLPTEMRTT